MKLLFFFLLFSPFIYSELFYLLDGNILQGDILSNTETDVTIQRFDNEGIISIPWTELLPKNRQQIQNKVGIIENKPIDITTQGVKIYLHTGDMIQGIKIQSKAPGIVRVRNRNGEKVISKSNILTENIEQIPLTEIYKDKELYQELKKLYKLELPENHLEFSKILIQANLFEVAKKHLEKAKQNQELLEQIEAQYKSIDYLKQKYQKYQQQTKRSQFLKYRSGHHYAKAFKSLQDLKNYIADQEYQKLYNETVKKEKEYYTAEITDLWMGKVIDKIRKIASKSFNEAQEYVLKKLDEEVVEELAKENELPTTTVIEYFQERTNKKTYRYSYSTGTFLVGLGNAEPENHKQPTFSKKNDKQMKDTEWWNIASITFSKKNDKQMKDTEWWNSANITVKRDWLKALYAENKLTVVKEEVKPCPACNASGVQSKRRCQTCQGICYQRTIVAK